MSSVSRHNEQELSRFRKDLLEALKAKAQSVLLRLNIPVPMDPEKNIYNSISYTINEQTGEAYLGSDLVYAGVLEWGRLPGSAPPFEPIHQWVIKKLGKTDPEAKSIAWAIVNHIKTEGVKGRRWMKITLEEFVRGA